MEPNKPLSV